MEDFWWSDDSGSKDLGQVLLLVGSLHSTLSTDLFTPLLPALLPPLLSILSDSYTNVRHHEERSDELGMGGLREL